MSFEVGVIGAGVSGLVAAARLARGGARVVVCEAAPAIGEGAAGKGLGILAFHLDEHPWRLLSSLEAAKTRELYAFAAQGSAIIQEILGLPPSEPALRWVAADPKEDEQIQRSIDALATLGIEVKSWKALEDRPAFTTGAGDTDARPSEILAILAKQVEEAGGTILLGARALSVDGGDGVTIRLADGKKIPCEVAIFAAGAGLPRLDPYFPERIFTYREQILEAEAGDLQDVPTLSMQGWVRWRTVRDRLVVSGCRWATPHLEDGETEPIVVDAIQQKLEGFVKRVLKNTPKILERRAVIETRSCDGLPLVGPIPGSSRLLVCAGFRGQHLSLAPAAGAALADGLLKGGSGGIPDFLRLQRLI